MIWALLAFLGVPLWFIALAILLLVFRNRALRRRARDVPVRVLRPRRLRWTRGHALWVSDVFAWRGSPAAWSEDLFQVKRVFLRSPDAALRSRLRGLGDEAVVATLSAVDGSRIDVAAGGEYREALLGPFARAAELEAATDSESDSPSSSSPPGGTRA